MAVERQLENETERKLPGTYATSRSMALGV